jgi:hypothetical protein
MDSFEPKMWQRRIKLRRDYDVRPTAIRETNRQALGSCICMSITCCTAPFLCSRACEQPSLSPCSCVSLTINSLKALGATI